MASFHFELYVEIMSPQIQGAFRSHVVARIV